MKNEPSDTSPTNTRPSTSPARLCTPRIGTLASYRSMRGICRANLMSTTNAVAWRNTSLRIDILLNCWADRCKKETSSAFLPQLIGPKRSVLKLPFSAVSRRGRDANEAGILRIGASRELFRLAHPNGWVLVTSPYVLEELGRNLTDFPLSVSGQWIRLRSDCC